MRLTPDGNEPSHRRARAERLIELGRPDQALAELERVLVADPADADALCLAAQAQLARGDAERAEELSRTALEVEPGGNWPLRLLALSLARLRRLTEAYDAAQAAVNAGPDVWQSHYTLAAVASAAPGLSYVALQAANRAVELAPLNPDTHAIRGRVAIDRDRALAEASLREALRLDPGHADAINDLGRLRLRRRDTLGAAAQFGHALKTDVRFHAAGENIEIAFRSALSIFTNCAVVMLMGLALVPDTWPGAAIWVTSAAAAVTALLAVGWLLRGLRHMPRTEALRYIGFVRLRDRRVAVSLALAAVGALVLLVECAVPPGSGRWATAAVGSVALIPGTLFNADRVSRRPRGRRG